MLYLQKPLQTSEQTYIQQISVSSKLTYLVDNASDKLENLAGELPIHRK